MEVERILQLPAESPATQLRNIVLTVISSQRLHKTIPELDVENGEGAILFDSDKEEFVPKDEAARRDKLQLDAAYHDAEDVQKEFLLALQEYQNTLPPKDSQRLLLIHGKHTWEEVLTTVNECYDTYRDKARGGLFGKLRSGFRKFGENSSAFDGWLGLIPSQDNYASILCGGLKIVIKAAGRINKIREEVVKALEDIPERLCETQIATALFKASDQVVARAVKVYVALLTALDHILRFLQDKPLAKVLRAVGRADRYEFNLADSLENLKRASERFREYVKLCSYEVGIETNKGVKTVQKTVESGFQQLKRIEVNFKAELKEQTGDLKKDILQGLYCMFIESPELQQLVEIANTLKKTDMLSQRDTQPPVSSHEILGFLGYNPKLHQTDLDSCLLLAAVLNLDDQNRAVELMTYPGLKRWMSSEGSSLLLVNGNGRLDRRSPLSFVCAKLLHSLAQTGNVLHISFFCAEHLNEETDYEASPISLVINFIGQLLGQRQFDLSEVKMEDLDQNDIVGLMNLLHHLILQLTSEDTLFCIIDSIGYFEDRHRRKKTSYVISELVQLCQTESGPSIKLLMTCPITSRVIWQHIPAANIYNMPGYLSCRGGFNSLNWFQN